MEIGFSLGSNLGDRLVYLQQARDRLLLHSDSRLLAQSPVYETAPVGVRPEYDDLSYLNSVVVLESGMSPHDWLAALSRIETELGRVRTDDRNAPRTIDIDIIYAGEHVIGSGGLEVPHPRWLERRFVVQPLADIRPELVIPESGKTVREILANLPPDEKVAPFAWEW